MVTFPAPFPLGYPSRSPSEKRLARELARLLNWIFSRSSDFLAPLESLQMDKRLVFAVIAVVAATIGFSLRGAATGQPVQAVAGQERIEPDPDGPTIGRFQIAAFGPRENGPGPGYYVIDTATGQVWMNYGDNKPSKVSDPLLK
jgi:hypothetical protein